jgi:cobalt-zinc-cadmium efflux system membrane fusion protein
MKVNILILLFLFFGAFLQNGCVKTEQQGCSGHDHVVHNQKSLPGSGDCEKVVPGGEDCDEGCDIGGGCGLWSSHEVKSDADDSDHDHEENSDHANEDDCDHGHEAIKAGVNESEHIHSYEQGAELPDLHCPHGFLVFACESCSYELSFVQVAADLQQKKLLRVEPVLSRSFSPELELRGELAFPRQAFSYISSRCDGLVRSVYVEIGDMVNKGERLAELECPELAVLQSDLLEAAAEQKLAANNLQRQKAIQAGDFLSLHDLERAEKELQVIEAKKDSARQRLLQLGMGINEIKELETGGLKAAGRIVLYSALSGEVLQFDLQAGEHVLAEEQRIMVGDTSRLWLWLNVPESQLHFLNSEGLENLEAIFKVSAWPGVEFSAEPDYLLPQVDMRSRMARLRLPVDNEDRKLFPGMYVTAVLQHKEAEYGPALPSAAILSAEGQDFVFVHFYENYFLRRNVKTGLRNNDQVQIYEGVEPGMMVVAEGNFLLKGEIMHDKMGQGCAH